MTTAVLLSGGLDSTVLAAHAADGGGLGLAVSFDYGQRHRRELASAAQVASHYRVEHLVIDLRPVLGACPPTSSALLGGIDVPEGHYAEATMAATVVPGRNLLMIAAAAAVAAGRGLTGVAIAAHAGDHPVYPDCRLEFLQAAGGALLTGYGLHLLSPFATLSKAAIVSLGATLGAPLDLTWSCYVGGDRHCGRCSTCVERIEAFTLAGVPDPTDYADPTFAAGVLTDWAAGHR